MDQRSGRRQGAATPQYSPDARWWWNGQDWQPVSPQASSGRPVMPGRWLYLVALLATAAALALFVVAGTSGGFPDNPTRVTAPGTAEVRLAEPGTYTISYEHRTAGGGGGEGAPSEVTSMRLELVSTDSATRVPIRPLAGDFISSEGSTDDVAIDEFSIDRPGTYDLVSQYSNGHSGPPVVLAVARGSTGNSGLVILGFLAATALLLAGLGLGAVTLALRIRAAWLRRRAPLVVAAASRPEASVDPFDPVAIRRALDHVEAVSQVLPEAPRAMVAEIRGEILELLPHASRFPPGSRDLFVLQRTATAYLPTSVDAYLALPADYATTAVLRDGKTALGILGDQLGLLDVEVGEIGDAVRHRDSERLLVHGRFLEQAFGRGPTELELPPSD